MDVWRPLQKYIVQYVGFDSIYGQNILSPQSLHTAIQMQSQRWQQTQQPFFPTFSLNAIIDAQICRSCMAPNHLETKPCHYASTLRYNSNTQSESSVESRKTLNVSIKLTLLPLLNETRIGSASAEIDTLNRIYQPELLFSQYTASWQQGLYQFLLQNFEQRGQQECIH